MTEVKRVPVGSESRNLIGLLFGGPFLGVSLMTVSTLFHGWYRDGLGTLGGFILISYVQRTKRIGTTKAGLVLLSWGFAGLVIGLACRGLAELASSGAYAHGRSSNAYVMVQLCVSTFVAWLVVGIPNRAFQIRLDPDGEGHARAALLDVLVWTAAILTGVNILMLHFRGGPLRFVDSGALTVGIIFTIVFAVPIYRFVAAACWNYGVARMFSPSRIMDQTIEHWRKVLPELQVAIDRAAERDGKLNPKVGSLSPRVDDGALDTAAASTNDQKQLRLSATATATGPRRTSSGRTARSRAARRARNKARKASGTTR